jgi:hypothetical protein
MVCEPSHTKKRMVGFKQERLTAVKHSTLEEG